jgi:hypothetical protein
LAQIALHFFTTLLSLFLKNETRLMRSDWLLKARVVAPEGTAIEASFECLLEKSSPKEGAM